MSDYSDADEFYVFIYDEKIDNNQTQLRRGSRGFKKGKKGNVTTERVLGFWCFNAGVGFKKI